MSVSYYDGGFFFYLNRLRQYRMGFSANANAVAEYFQKAAERIQENMDAVMQGTATGTFLHCFYDLEDGYVKQVEIDASALVELFGGDRDEMILDGSEYTADDLASQFVSDYQTLTAYAQAFSYASDQFLNRMSLTDMQSRWAACSIDPDNPAVGALSQAINTGCDGVSFIKTIVEKTNQPTEEEVVDLYTWDPGDFADVNVFMAVLQEIKDDVVNLAKTAWKAAKKVASGFGALAEFIGNMLGELMAMVNDQVANTWNYEQNSYPYCGFPLFSAKLTTEEFASMMFYSWYVTGTEYPVFVRASAKYDDTFSNPTSVDTLSSTLCYVGFNGTNVDSVDKHHLDGFKEILLNAFPESPRMYVIYDAGFKLVIQRESTDLFSVFLFATADTIAWDGDVFNAYAGDQIANPSTDNKGLTKWFFSLFHNAVNGVLWNCGSAAVPMTCQATVKNNLPALEYTFRRDSLNNIPTLGLDIGDRRVNVRDAFIRSDFDWNNVDDVSGSNAIVEALTFANASYSELYSHLSQYGYGTCGLAVLFRTIYENIIHDVVRPFFLKNESGDVIPDGRFFSAGSADHGWVAISSSTRMPWFASQRYNGSFESYLTNDCSCYRIDVGYSTYGTVDGSELLYTSEFSTPDIALEAYETYFSPYNTTDPMPSAALNARPVSERARLIKNALYATLIAAAVAVATVKVAKKRRNVKLRKQTLEADQRTAVNKLALAQRSGKRPNETAEQYAERLASLRSDVKKVNKKIKRNDLMGKLLGLKASDPIKFPSDSAPSDADNDTLVEQINLLSSAIVG